MNNTIDFNDIVIIEYPSVLTDEYQHGCYIVVGCTRFTDMIIASEIVRLDLYIKYSIGNKYMVMPYYTDGTFYNCKVDAIL